MYRKEIEAFMKARGINQIDLVYNKDDQLAIYCHLTGGTLKDFTDHVVDRKRRIWGYLQWSNGRSQRVPFNGDVE